LVSAGQVRDSVLVAINPESRLPDDEDACWRLYANLFHDAASGKSLRALVVLDDAKDDEQVRLLSPPPGCALLVTSRQQLQTGQSFHLDRLPRAEAMALLQAYAPRLTDEQASHLAELCGDLPVALKTAGGYLKQYRSKPADEYLAELQQDRLRRLGNKSQPNEDVNLIFDYSYRALDVAERLAWTALSIMPADFGREAGKAVIAAVIPSLSDSDVPNTGELLDRVVCLNLLDYDEEKERNSWHDLLREFAGARLSGEEGERAKLGHAEYFTRIGERTDELYLKGKTQILAGLALFDRERLHLEAAFTYLVSRLDLAKTLIRLVGSMLYTSSIRFHPMQRILWLEAQADAARMTGNREWEGSALCNVGCAYDDMGETCKAISCYEQALTINRETGDRRSEGIALQNLGVAYYYLGEPRKAIDYSEQQLVIAREIGDRRGEGNALNNLGAAYVILGETWEAIDYSEQQLVISREIEDRRGESMALNNLGLAHYYLGEERKAIGYYEQQLTITRETGDRRCEGLALSNLGAAYANLGEPREAIGYSEQHLVIALETGDRRGEGNALNSLGLAYYYLGKPHKAIGYFEQYLTIAHETGDRQGEGNALNSLGVAYVKLGEPLKAIEYLEQSLVIVRETGDRRVKGFALWNSALAYEALGERAQALPLAQQALAIFESIEDPNAVQVRDTLAQWQSETGAT